MGACDDDTKRDMGSRDVTSAYDDDTKGNICSRDVTSMNTHCSADNTTSEPPDKFPTYDAT